MCHPCTDEDLQTELDELRRAFAEARANMEKQEVQANMELRSEDAESVVSLQLKDSHFPERYAESEVSLQKRPMVPPPCEPFCEEDLEAAMEAVRERYLEERQKM